MGEPAIKYEPKPRMRVAMDLCQTIGELRDTVRAIIKALEESRGESTNHA